MKNFLKKLFSEPKQLYWCFIAVPWHTEHGQIHYARVILASCKDEAELIARRIAEDEMGFKDVDVITLEK